jgi:hypothetical protein
MIRRRNMNLEPVDRWTAVHVGVGVLAGLLRVPFRTSMGLAIGYEVLEQAIERTPAGRSFFLSNGPESLLNAVVDVGVFAVGHKIGGAL